MAIRSAVQCRPVVAAAGQTLIVPSRDWVPMAASPSPPPSRADGPGFPDQAILAEMAEIEEPAILYLHGGVIAAVNAAASRLSSLDAVGRSMIDLIARGESRTADGARLLPRDLPFMRALSGVSVDQGERIDIVLMEGTVYRALVTSSPVIRNGTVVGALSVWHDFDAYVRGLAARPDEE